MMAGFLAWLRGGKPEPADEPEADEAPAWFAQQVELAKWLVALSSGLMAFGFGALKEKPSLLSFWLFLVAGVAFVACIACAFLFILNSNTYERLRQQGAKKDGVQVRPSSGLRNLTYPGMMLTFLLGCGIFLAFAVIHLYGLTAPGGPRAPAIVALPAPAGPAVLAQRGERLWVLQGSNPAVARWEPLPPVPPAKEDTRS